MTALRSLLAGLIDYAGLFPPAALPMSDAVSRYGAHRRSRSAWALGRFVVPVARLAEFSDVASAVLPRGPGAVPWRLSGLLGDDPASDLGVVLAFNARHARVDEGRALVDTIEARVSSEREAEGAARLFEGFRMACELDARAAGFERVLRAVGSSGAVAKLRAGGVTERAVPDIDAVAAFVWGCARHDVPFKLTAGLHHAVRGVYAFTYDADSPRGVMHGLLNVLMAAMAARRLARSPGATAPSGATPDVPSQIRSILGEDDPGAFEIRADRVAWRSEVFTADEIEAVRAAFVLSVGSCSFDEPLEDVQAMSPA